MTSTKASDDGIAVPMTEVQALYDRHRYLDAYAASADYWTAGTDLRRLTTEQLILGGRLAGRLGGPRLSRRLLRAAAERDPGSPAVRYFTHLLKLRGRTVFDELRDFEARPDIGGDDPTLRAAWYSSFALAWAGLRDFQRAHECLATAHSLAQGDSWVLACESGVLGLDDRWADALAAADRARAADAGSPFAAISQGTCLLNLGRPRASARTLRAAAEAGQSFELAAYASWHHCALAETLDERERQPVLERASLLLDRAGALAPLADREVKQGLARARLDIASLRDDYAEIERWMEDVHSPFHRQVIANLRQNPAGHRIRLTYRRAVQKYAACLPTSAAMAMSANGLEVSTDEMAAAITFGGTAPWAAVDWLRARGHHVRPFAITAELSRTLIQNRIAFVLNWPADERGHAVAIVGLDERAQTLLVQDPGTFRSTEYLIGILDAAPSPLGTMGIAIVPPERAADLDALLPPDAEVMEATLALQRALDTRGPAAARPIAGALAQRFPNHPGVRQLEAVQLLADGHVGSALGQLQQLLARFPDAPDLRAHVLAAYQALRNTARLRLVLKDIVERDLLPGLTAEQAWISPPDRYVFGYADLLRLSSATRAEASRLLHALIRRQPASAGAWHTLGDLLSHTPDRAGAALCLRLASCLELSDEHYATAYAGALDGLGRPGDGLSWLEFRMRTAGAFPRGVGTWISWIAALEDHGEPARALTACQEALERHPRSVALLAFAVPFLGRMGQWDASAEHLGALESLENPSAYREAAAQFHSMRGELTDAIGHAESWVLDAPHAMNARRTLLELIALRDGPEASAERARAWMRANPGHEEFEDAYGAALGQAGAPRWKKDVVYRRRARRNPEDAVAWLEMAATALQVYAGAAEHRRARLVPYVEALLAQCERTAAGSTPTLRAQAWWSEVRGDWADAVSKWLEVNEREPVGHESCRRAWECSARFPDAERRRVWNEIRPRLLGAQGHLSTARELMTLLVERFGVSEANKELEQLRVGKPDDPCVLEAAVDLLLEHGRGRSDAQLALALHAPAADRFPHHLGLRFSLAAAYRAIGDAAGAESVLQDIVRRHPGNPAAKVQLAWAKLHGGDQDAACRLVESAVASAPRNPEVLTAQAAILQHCRGVDEARAAISQGLARVPKNVLWRTRAVGLLLHYGAVEEALAAAQHGVAIGPRNATLWLLLARTMGQLRRQFTVREVESCLRTSLRYDAGLFASSDLLAECLADREHYEDAVRVLEAIEPRMPDPSPARGRQAWVARRRTRRAEGLDVMAAIVAAAPWYEWGWSMLADWLEEDQDWQRARVLFDRVPDQLAHSLRFRMRRLQILGKAGVDLVRVNAEWNALLSDYPDDEALRAARSSWLRDVQPAHAVREAPAAPSVPPWVWGVLAMILINLLRTCQGL